MDQRLRRYYEALVRHDRREDHLLNEQEHRDVRVLVGIFGLSILMLAVALVICVTFLRSAHGHDAARPDLDEWFNRLSAGRGPCCSDHDGTIVSDPDWDSSGGHYHVRLEGRWIDVPDDVVVTKPNLDGRTMVWPMLINGETGIRCFMPGTMG